MRGSRRSSRFIDLGLLPRLSLSFSTVNVIGVDPGPHRETDQPRRSLPHKRSEATLGGHGSHRNRTAPEKSAWDAPPCHPKRSTSEGTGYRASGRRLTHRAVEFQRRRGLTHKERIYRDSYPFPSTISDRASEAYVHRQPTAPYGNLLCIQPHECEWSSTPCPPLR